MKLSLSIFAITLIAFQTNALPVKPNRVEFPITSSSTPKLSTATVDKSLIVPLDDWHCGSNFWEKWFAHSMAEADCPTQMIQTNACCFHHDNCYVGNQTQEECDAIFCQCLDDAMSQPECKHVSKTFCNTVKVFGAEAHKKSKKFVESTTETSKITTITAVKDEDRRLFEQAVNETLIKDGCFAELHLTCTSDLNSCRQESSTCNSNFCHCARQDLEEGRMNSDCQVQFRQLCRPYLNDNDAPKDIFHSTLKSPNWIEENLGLSIVQTVLILICLFVSIASASFWLTHYLCRQRQMRKSSSTKGFIYDTDSSSSKSSNSSASSLQFVAENSQINNISLL